MGMHTTILFLKDKTDPTYQRYLKILELCMKAGVGLPKEVDDYFGGFGIDNNPEEVLEISCGDLKNWGNDHSEGYELEVKDIPQGTKTIRFYNSW